MASIDSIMNWAIPGILLLIAFGFIYTKFLSPWVMPMLAGFWEWLKGKGSNATTINNKKEITYE